MLVVRKVGVGQADYYLDGRTPGLWAGAGAEALSLAGAIDRTSFVEALSGSDPDGHHLLRRKSPQHRAGFDLVFAASKSVSLLAGLTDRLGSTSGPTLGVAVERSGVRGAVAPLGPIIVGAHDAAVADTLAYLERWAC